jgi:WD40 repeat protein
VPSNKDHLDLVKEALSARSDEATRLDSGGLIQPFAAPEGQVLWVFFSYAWLNEEEHAVQTQFYDRLAEKLAYPPESFSHLPKIRLWRDIHNLRASDQGDAQIDAACQRSAIGLLMLSDKYPHSAICQREAAFFLTEDGNNQLHKKCVIVGVNVKHHEIPTRYTANTRLLLLGPKGENLIALWSRGNPADRLDFVNRTSREIFLAANALVETGPQPPILTIPTAAEAPKPLEIFFSGRRVINPDLMVEPRADVGNMSPDVGPQARNVAAVPIVDHLVSWATSAVQGDPRLVAILGEFGMGKTVACQMFTQKLLDLGRTDSTTFPIYFDLRDIDRVDEDGPKLEVLIDQMLRKAGGAAPSARDVIGFARERGAIVIFDGLDELTNKMSSPEAIRLYRELLAIVPSELWVEDAYRRRQARRGNLVDVQLMRGPRVVVSCRTHYFKDIAAQRGFLTGMERSRIDADADAALYFMLPFTTKQITTYLNLHFSAPEAARAFDLIKKTYNLRELAERPILLRFIRETFGRLEKEKLAGRPINLTRLYDIFVDQVFERDNPKHTIPVAEKRKILRGLALHLHVRGSNDISNDRLDEWLRDFTTSIPLLASALKGRDVLTLSELFAQDMRNASLLVRPGDHAFSFAHTSIREYFLASALYATVVNGKGTSAWNVEMPTPETLMFLLQRHEIEEQPERRAFEDHFPRLLEPNNSAKIRGLAFELWRMAAASKALPRPGRIDLSNLNLQRQRIAGDPTLLLPLQNSTWRGASLRQAEFEHVNLAGADFSTADAQMSTWLSCDLDDANFDDTNLTETMWRDCNIPAGSLTAGQFTLARAISSTYAGDDWRPQGMPPSGAIWCARALAERRNKRNYVFVAAFERTPLIVAASREGTLRVFDLDSREQFELSIAQAERAPLGGVATLELEDQRFALASTGYGHVGVFDLLSRRQISAIQEELSDEPSYGDEFNAVSIAAFEGEAFIAGNTANGVIFNPLTGAIRQACGIRRAKCSTLAMREGRIVMLSVGYDNALQVSDLATGETVMEIPSVYEATNCVIAGVVDNRSIGVLGSALGFIYVFDLKSGDHIQTIHAAHRGVTSLTVAHVAGEACVLSGHEDSVVCIHELFSKRLLVELRGHQHAVTSLKVGLQEGRPAVVSGGDDGTVRIFQLDAFDTVQRTYINHETGSFIRLDKDSFDNERLLEASSDAWRDFAADYKTLNESGVADIADMPKRATGRIDRKSA